MKKYILSLVLCTCSFLVLSQTVPQQDWVQTFNGAVSLNDGAFMIDVDGSIIVAGLTETNPGTFKILTVKYTPDGTQLWAVVFNSPGLFLEADLPNSVTTDNFGNIYIAASIAIGNSGPEREFTTIKYDSSGVLQWVATHIDSGGAQSLTLDPAGNVYVTGVTRAGTPTREDFTTVKYNSSGVEQWTAKFGGVNREGANSIAIDNAGAVYITGFSWDAITSKTAHTTVKYNNNGVQQWASTFTNGSFAFTDDERDASLAASNLVLDNGDVYVTASGDNGGTSDYVTIKYNNAGTQQWIGTHNGSGNGADYITDLVLLSNGDIVITGESFGGSSDVDFVTVKYDANGAEQWTQRYNGVANGTDKARGLDVDNMDNIYITGVSFNGTNNDFATVKYSDTGVEEWDMIFNGVADDNDEANDIGVDAAGNVYVVGLSSNGSNFDYTTVKYGLKEIFLPLDFSLADFGIQELPNVGNAYYGNQGQIIDTDGNLMPEVLSYTINTHPQVMVTTDKLYYQFTNRSSDTTTSDTTLRVGMSLVGATVGKFFKAEKIEGNVSYYLPHAPSGITNIGGYSRLICNNVYPNIDLQYYSNSEGLKMYFIVHPGGNADDIVMDFTGSLLSVDVTGSGGLKVSTPLGNVKYEAPHAYQINPAGKVVPMPWQAKFEKAGATKVKMDIRNYAHNMSLIIQVDKGGHALTSQTQADLKNVEWSTLYRGFWYDWSHSVTTDANGDIFMVGESDDHWTGLSTKLIVTGNNSTNAEGNRNGFIVKFREESGVQGVRKWAIFYAGTGAESFNDVVAIASKTGFLNGAVIVTGTTNSTDLPIPAIPINASAYHQTNNAGGEDAVVVWFDNSNVVAPFLRHASYIGGTGDEQG